MHRLSEKAVSRISRLFRSRGGAALCALLLAAHLGVTAWGVHNHEPWRDEAQKWLLARDAGSVAEIWERLPYEGTPALWLLLLRPFARAGLPYAAMSWLNWAIVGAAAALLAFASPLPWHLKAATLFSYGLIYQYPVFASNYSLSLLLLFVVLSLYPGRRARPLRLGIAVALLANASALGALLALPIAAVIGAEAVRERPASRRPWAALGIAAAGFVLVAAQLAPARLGAGSSIENEFFNRYITARKGVLMIASEGYFPVASLVFRSPRAYRALGAAGLLLLALVAAGVRRRPKALFLLVTATCLYLLVFTHVASVGRRHAVFLTLSVVAALWMAGVEPREARASSEPGGERPGRRSPSEAVAIGAAMIVIALSGLGGVKMLRAEAQNGISRSREVAGFLKSGGLLSRPIIAYPAGVGSALLPYLPGLRLYYPGIGEYGTFVEQGARLWAGEVALNPDRVLRESLCRFPAESWLVLLGGQPTADLAPFCRGLLAPPRSEPRSLEDYWLFECAAGAPDGRLFPRESCGP